MVGYKLTITMLVLSHPYLAFMNGACTSWWCWYIWFWLHVFHLRMKHIPHDYVDIHLSWSCMYAYKNETLSIYEFSILKMMYASYWNSILASLLLYYLWWTIMIIYFYYHCYIFYELTIIYARNFGVLSLSFLGYSFLLVYSTTCKPLDIITKEKRGQYTSLFLDDSDNSIVKPGKYQFFLLFNFTSFPCIISFQKFILIIL